jgi:hypothetical protein
MVWRLAQPTALEEVRPKIIRDTLGTGCGGQAAEWVIGALE